MQVPIDYPAIVPVLALAGAVNLRVRIQPKANDTGWVVIPNLWGGIAAPPGFMKSPVIQAVVGPLTRIQRDWRIKYEQEVRQYADANEEHELKHSALREQFKASEKQGKSAPKRPDDGPVAPVLRRLIVNDATFEALHLTMSENPLGILVIRDELTGLWSTLDRAGREGERAFCLQAWNGDTEHTIDRNYPRDDSCRSVLLDSGIRPEECFRLRWENHQDGVIEITQGKTDNSRRRIPLSPRAQAVLEMRRPEVDGPWIFPAPTMSGHIEPSSLQGQHAKACKLARVAHFPIYTFRHTCLTRWAPFMDPWTLAYLAGHRDMSITRRYVHPQEFNTRVAMEKARAALSGHNSGHTPILNGPTPIVNPPLNN